MNQAYDYLLTVAEGLLKESSLPSEIIKKYFALKNLTFSRYSISAHSSPGQMPLNPIVTASPRKSTDKEKVLTRLISVLQSTLSKGDAHPFIQTIREDAQETGEKDLVEYVENQMRMMECSSSAKKRSQKEHEKSQAKFDEDDLIHYHQSVQYQLNALQLQNDQLIQEIERLGQLAMQHSTNHKSNQFGQLVSNNHIESSYQEQLDDEQLEYEQQQQQSYEEEQSLQDEEQDVQQQNETEGNEEQLEDVQGYRVNAMNEGESQSRQASTQVHVMQSLRRENESLKSELRQHQQFHMESIRKVMQSMKRNAQATQQQQNLRPTSEMSSHDGNGQIENVLASAAAAKSGQLMEGLLVQVDEYENAARVDSVEKQTILSHMKVFSSKFERLLSKYINEINTSEFTRLNEELAFYVDFIIFVAGKFETDNMWLISKLVELNKQTELLEKSVVLNEKKSFYDDLEQTYIEMKHELQNTVKKQLQIYRLGSTPTIHPHPSHHHQFQQLQQQ